MIENDTGLPANPTPEQPDRGAAARPEADVLPEIDAAALPAPLREAIGRAGWTELVPVQQRAIPYVLAGRNVMVQARTGSGKTGAFVLPMIKKLNPRNPACQALVLVPTRELAKQVARDAEQLFGPDGLKVVAVYGGVGFGPQLEAFRTGAQLVVGTPGRILDHLVRRTLSFAGVRMLVFDEADRMLSIGFYPDMKEIKRHLPASNYDAFMFSATFPPQVVRLASEFLRDPEMLSLSGGQVHVAETEHIYYEVPSMGRERCLMRIIEVENPAQAIVFCNTKADVHFVTAVLQQFGYDADELSADLSQAARESVLARVRAGRLRFLVATDVAARGIDIKDLSHVIQYAPSEDRESYIHRAGRTGRAGASGVAITLADVMQRMEIVRTAKHYTIEMQKRELPTDAEVQEAVGQRVTALLEARLREYTSLERERLERLAPLARTLGQGDGDPLLVAMLLDGYHQTTLHGPPVPTEAASAPVERREDDRREDDRREPDRGRPGPGFEAGRPPRRRRGRPRGGERG